VVVVTEATFEERLQAFEARLAKVEHERDEYKKLAGLLQEQVERLKRGLLGQKAERLPQNDAQLSLAILNLALGGEALAPLPPSEPLQTVPAHQRKKPVRKPFSEDLPRVDVEILPPEVLVEGIENFELVGENSREVLERRPASAVVVTLRYKKFLRKGRDRTAEATEVLVAPAVELPIERGTAGPSMLADTIVRRWQDHQPLNRLEDIYSRENLGLAKSTLCTWHEQLAELVRPLVDAMFQDAYREPYLCVDATGVLMQAKEKCRNAHFWVLVAPEKHVLYGYSRSHDGKAVDKLLQDYKGYLVADAHSVYEHLYHTGDVIEVGCWAHYLEPYVIRRVRVAKPLIREFTGACSR
jgi:transposase